MVGAIPKTTAERQPTATASVVRLERAKDAAGKTVAGKWNCVEETVTGVVTARKVHADTKALPIARELFRRLLTERLDGNPEDQKW